MKVVIFTGGDFKPSKLSEKAIKEAELIIAADYGAKAALEIGIIPDVVVGDMDSIDNKTREELTQRGVKFLEFPKEKDDTDTQLAINYAIEQKTTEITILSGIEGDRLDHIFANVLISSKYDVPITFINGSQKAMVRVGPQKINLEGESGDILSLVPISESVDGISTENLQYSLHNESLFSKNSRGISNVFTDEKVEIKFSSGTLCIIQTTHVAGE